ncbi:MAG: hypothetical protein WAN65_17520 [Candidatus Sulfotelmatobacter sp.]
MMFSKEQAEQFEDWYRLYPRHLARDDAEAAFAKRVDGELFPRIMAALRSQLPGFRQMQAEGRGSKIPYPASWLNGRRWLDEIESDQPPQFLQPTAVHPSRIVR